MESLTPPDTIQQEVFKQRAALKEAQKDSGFSLEAFATTPMETPAFGTRGVKFAAPGAAAASVDSTPAPTLSGAGGCAASGVDSRVRDVLLYANPPMTYLVIIMGTVVLGLGHFLLSGVHNVTLLTAICYALLAKLALNFFRGLVSSDWAAGSRWSGSGLARAAAARAVAAVEGLVSAHDTLLASDSPTTSLRVAGALWALAVIGRWLSIWSVVTLSFLVAFTLPAAYKKHEGAAKETYARVAAALSARWNGLLSRKQKLAVLALGLIVMLVHSAWSTRLCALLAGALAVRCHLKPAEVQRIQQIAEPYTQTARKQARRVSMAATDFALRSLGGKAHFG